MSALQARAAADLLRTVPLSAQAKGKIAVLVADLPWACVEHRDLAMAQVLGVEGLEYREPITQARRTNQQWESCVHALPRSVWAVLEDPATSTDGKIDVVHAFLADLGLRLPTEQTSKRVCELILVATEGLDTASTLTRAVKAAFNSRLKKLFKRKVRRMPAPSPWVDELPGSIDFLNVSHAELYHRVYVATNDRHVNCKWSAAQMAGVGATFPCRASSTLLREAQGAIRPRIDMSDVKPNSIQH